MMSRSARPHCIAFIGKHYCLDGFDLIAMCRGWSEPIPAPPFSVGPAKIEENRALLDYAG
jgi:hypothetical protein